MGQGDWVSITVTNKSKTRTMKISSLTLQWGKLYDGPDDRETEVSSGRYVDKEIAPKGSIEFYSCGRSDSASGSEGSFTVVDVTGGDAEICTVHWDVPFSGSNRFYKESEDSDNYTTALSSFSTSGPLKHQTVDISYNG